MPVLPLVVKRLFIAVLLLLIPQFVLAQTSAGALGGHVADESGGVLPGVTVTATNTATGFSRNVVTGTDGGYRFPSLPIGT